MELVKRSTVERYVRGFYRGQVPEKYRKLLKLSIWRAYKNEHTLFVLTRDKKKSWQFYFISESRVFPNYKEMCR